MRSLSLWKATYTWTLNSSTGMDKYKVEYQHVVGYFATTASSIEGLRHYINSYLDEQSEVQVIEHAEFLGQVIVPD